MNSMPDESKKRVSNGGIAGVAIPGGLLLGMGIGFFVDNLVGGMFVGLDGGFLIMLTAMVIMQINSRDEW